jgi:phage terminase large subunit-like protein
MSSTTPSTASSGRSLGPQFQRFCATYLRHIAGPFARKPFILEGWQVEWSHELLRQDEHGNFVYHEALLGIARGNGKSALASALCLFFLFVVSNRDPGAEIYALAGSMAQGRIVFGEAKKMLEASPLIDYAKLYRDAIHVPDTGAVFRVIPSGRPELLHGLKPSFYIGDEIHGWHDPELWYAMSSAQEKRPNSLGVGISTAGHDLRTILGQLYQRGKAGEEGLFFTWFEASDPANPETWKEANPSSWITQEMLERQARKLPAYVFNRLIGNVWTRTVEAWLPLGAWDDCKTDETIEPEEPLHVGLDLGFKHDHTAVVEVARRGDRYITRSTTFATWPDPSQPKPLATHVFEEDRQAHTAVAEHILSINARNPITELVFDPAGSHYFIEQLEAQGVTCVEFPQSNPRMTKATDTLYGVIADRLLGHDGDEAFKAHIDACTIKWVGEGTRLWKQPDKSPMDSGIALAIAVDRAHANAGDAFNVRFL